MTTRDVVQKVDVLAAKIVGYPANVKSSGEKGKTVAFSNFGYQDRALIRVGDQLIFLSSCRFEHSISGCGGLGYNTYATSFVSLCEELGLLTPDEGKEWNRLNERAKKERDLESELKALTERAATLGFELVKKAAPPPTPRKKKKVPQPT